MFRSFSLGLLLTSALLVLTPSASAQASGWQNCGEQRWWGADYFRVEAKAYSCGSARKMVRGYRSRANQGNCDTMIYCQVEGFDCLTLRSKKKIICTKDQSRVRLLKGRGWRY